MAILLGSAMGGVKIVFITSVIWPTGGDPASAMAFLQAASNLKVLASKSHWSRLRRFFANFSKNSR